MTKGSTSDQSYVRRTDGHSPKHAQLQENLRVLIEHSAPGALLPSVAQLRAEHGVSQATVDRAYRALRSEGLIESAQGKGTFVSPMGKLTQIAMVFGANVFDEAQMAFGRLLLKCFQTRARTAGKLLSYYHLEGTVDGQEETWPAQLLWDLRARRVQGIVAVVAGTPEWWDRLESMEIPLVLFSNREQYTHRVCIDRPAVVRMGVEALARAGCRRIALWHKADHPMASEEVAAFRAALAETGASSRPEWVASMAPPEFPLHSVACDDFRKIWQSWEHKPDGLVSMDDQFTIGLLHAADLLGLTVPGGLTVATQANKGLRASEAGRVIRIELDVPRMAERMLDRLDVMMAGETPEPAILAITPRLMKANFTRKEVEGSTV